MVIGIKIKSALDIKLSSTITNTQLAVDNINIQAIVILIITIDVGAYFIILSWHIELVEIKNTGNLNIEIKLVKDNIGYFNETSHN